METLDQALGFRIAGFADQHLGGQDAAKCMACRGEFGLACPPPPDRAFAVPHQNPWHGTQHRKMLPPAGIEVFSARSGSTPLMPTVNTRRPSSTPAGPWRYGPGRTQPAPPHRETKVALRDLTGNIGRARRRIRRQVHRSQLPHPLTECSDRIRPADPLGDHRRRHPRIGRQQLPNPGLGLISHRTRRCPLILRRTIRGQRRLHRVPRNPQHPRDLRNRQPSDRRNRRISAQSSTLNTRFLLGS